MKKIFVTGHLGYIGVHVVDLLKKSGHVVIGCDLNLFEDCQFEDFERPDEEIIADFRTLEPFHFQDVDCVMHLAAISNDPMGDLDPEITYSINQKGTFQLASSAKQGGVPLFLFASSCSIYGKGESLDIDEKGETSPLTAYAVSKIESEKILQELSSKTFKTVSLRNATAYGFSPMLRIDLVVNNLLACAFAKSEIRVLSDGSPWRPLIHCIDIARAFIAFLNTPLEETSFIVNVGANDQNFQVKDVVQKVHAKLPHTKIIFTGEVGKDPRNYRVNFDLLSKTLPNFSLEYSLDKGIDELFHKYQEKNFSINDFEKDEFVRLRVLKKRLERLYRYNPCIL